MPTTIKIPQYKIESFSWRMGVVKGMWNAYNPNDPEFPNTSKSDRLTLEGYHFGYDHPEDARQILKDFTESEQWS